MSEPISPVGWVALLAAVLLPAAVALTGFWVSELDRHQERQLEVLELRARVIEQEAELRRLQRQVDMLEDDLNSVVELD